ncbi:MAG TPA: cation:dicarboxylase symporter family transporter [Burkholderiales bacterium]|nr:cation:dicarboxylase symporter family transporter [Burkholderiales bacterium]
MEQLGKFRVKNKLTSFVLPLGYSFDLDGSMMYCTFAVLFIAQAYGAHALPAGSGRTGTCADKIVAVTGGTTNEQGLRAVNEKQKLGLRLVTAADHDESFRMLTSKQADAFATDDVLFYGWIARTKSEREYIVVGEYLSYDPYGIMFRRNDPQFAAVVERRFRQLAESRALRSIYRRGFQRRVPAGENLALPMSPQLESIFEALGLPEE